MTELSDIFKQARIMQEQMQKVQKELQIREVTGESGAGLVRVTMNGRHDVKQVQIDRTLLTEEPAILEDLIAAAVNDAVRRVEENNKSALSGIASGLNLPPGFNFGI